MLPCDLEQILPYKGSCILGEVIVRETNRKSQKLLISKTNSEKNTVELQWLQYLRDHENMFETGVVRANEC